MMKSTVEKIEGTGTVNVEDIPSDKLRELLEGVNREIEKLEQDKRIMLAELERREENQEKK